MEEIEAEKIEAEEKDSVGYAPDYTFEVNSPTALSNWANNVTSGGQDYTSVVIRRGTWSITRSLNSDSDAAINLILTGTKRVIGDADSLIIVNLSNGKGSAIKGQVTNTYPNLVNPDDNSKDHSMTGVSIKVTAPAGQIIKIFTNCTNLTNCTAIGKGYGFDNCTNLINCTATMTHDNSCPGFFHCIDLVNCISTANSSVSSAFGFSGCTNLINCKGNASAIGSSMGCGFYDCRNLTNCTGAGTGSIYCYGFFNCKSMTLNRPGSTSSAGTYSGCTVGYASGSGTPADTAAGGWNSDTVITAEEDAEHEHVPHPEPAVK